MQVVPCTISHSIHKIVTVDLYIYYIFCKEWQQSVLEESLFTFAQECHLD